MNSSIIHHKGVVQKIENNELEVMILSESACSSCKSKKVCSISEVKEKSIFIHIDDETYRVGDQINVLLEERMGVMAILFAYFFPFIVFISVLFICYYLKLSEPIMGISVIFSLALYYLIIYLSRNYFNKRMEFKVEKIDSSNITC